MNVMDVQLKACTLNAVDLGDDILLSKLITAGHPIHGSCAYRSAKRGDIECLKVLHKNGCYWNEKTCAYAAFNGNLECLKYAHMNGCPWNKTTLHLAVNSGHLECVKYYINNAKEDIQLTIDRNTASCIAIAVHNGHLHCLKFLHENGYKMNKEVVLRQAACRGHTECVSYAVANGCTIDLVDICKSIRSVEHSYHRTKKLRYKRCAEYLETLKTQIKACVKIQAFTKGILLRKRLGVHNPHCTIGKEYLKRLFYITIQ